MFKRRDEEIGFAYSDKIHWLQLRCLDHRLCQGRQSNGFPPNFVHSLDVALVEMIPPWGWDAGSLWYLHIAKWNITNITSGNWSIIKLNGHDFQCANGNITRGYVEGNKTRQDLLFIEATHMMMVAERCRKQGIYFAAVSWCPRVRRCSDWAWIFVFHL